MASSVSNFEHTAETLGLSREAAARAWEMLREARIGPEDPEAVRILLHISLLEDAVRIQQAARSVLDEARETITQAAKNTAGRVADTAARVERASAVRMAASKAELAASVGADIAEAADRALTRKVAVLSRNTLAGWLSASLLAVAAMSAVAYHMGRTSEAATSAELSDVLQREDGSAWRGLMAANNGAEALATYCRSGSPNIRRVDGGTICTVPLWLQHDGVVSAVPGRPAEGNAVLAAAGDWLATWGPWWLLAAGAVGLLLVRKLARGFGAWPPLRWLLDLTPSPSVPVED
jgi:hypothetical protein